MARSAQRALAVAVGLTGAGLLVAATLAEADRLVPQAGQTTLIPLVGAGLLVAAAVARGAPAMGWALAAAGILWLLPSLVAGTERQHQAALVIALGASLAPRRVGWVGVGSLAVVLLAGSSQLIAAGVFLVLATAAVVRRRPLVAAAAGTLALVLAGTWGWSRSDPFGWDPVTGLVAYELGLLLVAVILGPGSRFAEARTPLLRDRLVGGQREGLDGLAEVLRGYLRDPGLRIDPPDGEGLGVSDGGRALVTISSRSQALDDPRTSEAVRSAVRLVALAEERRRELDRHAADLQQAQARLEVAVDDQRVATALQLREEVIGPVEQAIAMLRQAVPGEAVHSAIEQLVQCIEGVEATAFGMAPRPLGDGRIAEALEVLATRSAVRCELDLDPDARADVAVETTLFYVCSEALANAAKHARAEHVLIVLRRSRDQLELEVTDDGVGGADPLALGFRGLEARVGRAGGRLRVESPPGAGTRVIASVPRSSTRSASMAGSSGAILRPR